MDEEILTMNKNATWFLEELLSGRKKNVSKWVLKKKLNPKGRMEE